MPAIKQQKLKSNRHVCVSLQKSIWLTFAEWPTIFRSDWSALRLVSTSASVVNGKMCFYFTTTLLSLKKFFWNILVIYLFEIEKLSCRILNTSIRLKIIRRGSIFDDTTAYVFE